MDKKEFTPRTNLEHQISALEVVIYNLQQTNTPHLNAHTKKMLNSITQNIIDAKNEIRKSVNELDKEYEIKNILQEDIQELDVTIIKLQNARNENLPTNTKNKLTLIINYLVDTRDKIATHIAQFGQTSPTYIQKMLAGAKALCEEHEDIVKNIVDEPNIYCETTYDIATSSNITMQINDPTYVAKVEDKSLDK